MHKIYSFWSSIVYYCISQGELWPAVADSTNFSCSRPNFILNDLACFSHRAGNLKIGHIFKMYRVLLPLAQWPCTEQVRIWHVRAALIGQISL